MQVDRRLFTFKGNILQHFGNIKIACLSTVQMYGLGLLEGWDRKV
jgi:hypothetical protein